MILTDEQEQYKETLRTLNTEVKKLNEKLEKKGHQKKKKEQEDIATIEKELTTLLR